MNSSNFSTTTCRTELLLAKCTSYWEAISLGTAQPTYWQSCADVSKTTRATREDRQEQVKDRLGGFGLEFGNNGEKERERKRQRETERDREIHVETERHVCKR